MHKSSLERVQPIVDTARYERISIPLLAGKGIQVLLAASNRNREGLYFARSLFGRSVTLYSQRQLYYLGKEGMRKGGYYTGFIFGSTMGMSGVQSYRSDILW